MAQCGDFQRKSCKIAEQYLKKGSKVYLEGQLQTRKFTDKNGAERQTTEVVLQRYRGELTLLIRAAAARQAVVISGPRIAAAVLSVMEVAACLAVAHPAVAHPVVARPAVLVLLHPQAAAISMTIFLSRTG